MLRSMRGRVRSLIHPSLHLDRGVGRGATGHCNGGSVESGNVNSVEISNRKKKRRNSARRSVSMGKQHGMVRHLPSE